MFTEPTVFVLGAGASWHYGYPTGEGLIECVISMAGRFRQYCRNRLDSGHTVQVLPTYVEQRLDRSQGMSAGSAAWKQVHDECEALIHRLRTVRPLVIDYFLAWNESLRSIGNLMIAAVILECEATWLKEQANQNRRAILTDNPMSPNPDEVSRLDIRKYKDNWYRFIVHKLVYGCGASADLLRNDVQFVTFNYDTSLEYHLHRSLTAIDFIEAADAKTFLCSGRIVHVYGSIRADNPTEAAAINLDAVRDLGKQFVGSGSPNFSTEFEPRKAFLDLCLRSANDLRTIDPHDKAENEALLQQARVWIEGARYVYVLGYGFDPNNSSRIGLGPVIGQPRLVDAMFTNYLDVKVIAKRATNTFRGWNRIEASAQNVYEALEKDFDGLFGELIPQKRI